MVFDLPSGLVYGITSNVKNIFHINECSKKMNETCAKYRSSSLGITAKCGRNPQGNKGCYYTCDLYHNTAGRCFLTRHQMKCQNTKNSNIRDNVSLYKKIKENDRCHFKDPPPKGSHLCSKHKGKDRYCTQVFIQPTNNFHGICLTTDQVNSQKPCDGVEKNSLTHGNVGLDNGRTAYTFRGSNYYCSENDHLCK
jgi:hypothetical protein